MSRLPDSHGRAVRLHLINITALHPDLLTGDGLLNDDRRRLLHNDGRRLLHNDGLLNDDRRRLLHNDSLARRNRIIQSRTDRTGRKADADGRPAAMMMVVMIMMVSVVRIVPVTVMIPGHGRHECHENQRQCDCLFHFTFSFQRIS